ncbi:class I SAM-dependent methyltransferase [Sulfurimonas sp. SWIR-19]|uniref:class I SAM-dependent methyltransferase n=1 Tax=Sulfurimonas sp. SWIR-19 TaxID=2878390 RepID=UPI001CF408FE|nr:class I SAM-dependent methyltransferase [Sulfurimonas sp. SWIR-19]UCM99271.1 class I SAM-dependent methyltransferase [Sulfurimonas sp. SWIR-19]
MLTFTHQTMTQITKVLQNHINTMQAKEIISFQILNPDIATSLYNGTRITCNDQEYIYRGYKSWMDLAHLLRCRMLTPKIADEHTVIMRYEKLDEDSSFHKNITDKEEKYGENSIFTKIHKNEEASFIYSYTQALENVHLNKRVRILNLGVNSGDEFEVITSLADNFEALELVGIDYCESAIDAAKKKFKNFANISLHVADINSLNALDLGKFDLIISIGTLQSSNLAFNKVLMSIVQNQLKKEGAIILGFPNCRWVDGEMLYGARVKNYAFSEMGLLYKDVIFAKKYLQQKKFRVTVTGKDYIFVTATSIRKD